MVRPRILAVTLLLVGLIAPLQLVGVAPGITHADAQVVWHLDRGTFDPSTGQATVAQTFTPRSAVYLVEVELSSPNAGDEAYIQLGSSEDDVTQVQSGEDRFFVASNLVSGSIPSFRIIADPKHAYAGRVLTYAVAVYTVPPTGTDISGVAVSAVPNVVAFHTPQAAAYTVQYHLNGGSGRLIIINGSGATIKDFGIVTGDGATTATLQAGTFALGLEQTPKGSAISWTLHIGLAPHVGALHPPDRAQLQHSPATLFAVTQQNARLVLDNKAVAAAYNAGSGQLVYRPTTPLAPGLHQLAVEGPDGTQATAISHFLVLPSRAAATSNAGSGLVQTTTPDGRYRLLKPASWRMAGSGGTVYLVDPQGKALIMLSERYLGQTVDAGTIVRTIGDKLGGKYGLVGSWSYGGSAASATFRGTLKGTGHAGSFAMIGRALPTLANHSLLIAYGFDQVTPGAPDAATLVSIEASLAANDAAGIVAARPMLHYAADVVSLEYPADWLANFTNTQGSWFIGPNDQSVLIAAGIPIGATVVNASILQSAGHQIQDYIRSQIHATFKVVQEKTTAQRYRWLGTFSDSNGQLAGVEVGEIVAHNGQLVALYGDTALDQAPTNLPLFAHVLDTASRSAGVTADGEYTINDVATALRAYTLAATSNGSATASGGTGGKSVASSYLSPYKAYLNEQSSYQSVLDSSYGMYAAEMNVGSNFGDSGISYTYTSSTW